MLLCIARSWTGEGGGGDVTLALQNYAFGNFDIITHFLCFNNLGKLCSCLDLKCSSGPAVRQAYRPMWGFF